MLSMTFQLGLSYKLLRFYSICIFVDALMHIFPSEINEQSVCIILNQSERLQEVV